MAITVEDGSIVAGGNVYASLADVDTYHEDRANALWTDADDTAKEAAMLRATAGIESKYRERWIGVKTNNSITVIPQLLAWPRRKLKSETPINPDTLAVNIKEADITKLEDFDGIVIPVKNIPALVIQAYKEVCLIEVTQPFVSIELSRNDMLKYQRIDVIEQEWLRNAPAVVQFPHIDSLLTGLASTAPVKLGASIGLTEAEQDSLTDTGAYDRWFTSLLVT